MRYIYALVIIFLCLAAALLAVSFIYFDRTQHQRFYYLVTENGTEKASVELDRYVTQDNVIYKARENTPYEMDFTAKQSRLVLGRGVLPFKEYEVESLNDFVKEQVLLKNIGDRAIYLACAKSKFLYFDRFKFNPGLTPFDRYNVITWWPFVKSYNYNKGGAQFFTAIKFSGTNFLPYEGVLTLTSIRDEYVDVDGRKVKTECLVLSESGKQQGLIWVSKHGHDIVAAEIPGEGLRYGLTGAKKQFVVKDYKPAGGSSVSQTVTFYSNGREVRGVLSRPAAKGVYPAVLLLPGEEAAEKNNFGIYADLANFLADKGYVALRFEFLPASKEVRLQARSVKDDANAVDNALNLLEDYRFVDTNRIGIIAHSDANYTLPRFLKGNTRIKAWVMLSARRPSLVAELGLRGVRRTREDDLKDPNYDKDFTAAVDETMRIVNSTDAAAKNILGKRVFLSRMREIEGLGPLEDLKEITIPVLVLQGKEDNAYYLDFFKSLEKGLAETGGSNRTIVYFRTLPHYFGKLEKSELIMTHYLIDTEVSETIKGWLDKNLKAPAQAPGGV